MRPNMVTFKYPNFLKKCWSKCSCQSVQFCGESKCKNLWRIYHHALNKYVKRYSIGLVPQLHVKISSL
jgi:hypothetical protein